MSKFPADFNGFTTSGDRTYYDPPTVNPEDLERKKFEKWLKSKGHRADRDINGDYVFSYAASTWSGWIARSKEQS